MPKFFANKQKKNNINNAKKPKRTPEEKIKRYRELIDQYQDLIDGLRDRITEDEGKLELMNDIPEFTEQDMAEQQSMIFKTFTELDHAIRNKKRYEQKMKLVVIPVAMKAIQIDDESEDDDVIIMDVIDLTKDDN